MPMSPQDRVEQTRWLAVLALAAGAVYLCWTMLAPFIGVLITAVVLVIVFYPAHERLSQKVKQPGLAAFLSTAGVIVVLVLPLLVVTVAMIKQLPAAVTFARDTLSTLLAKLEESDRLRPFVANWKQELQLDDFLQSDSAKHVLKGTLTVVGGLL